MDCLPGTDRPVLVLLLSHTQVNIKYIVKLGDNII